MKKVQATRILKHMNADGRSRFEETLRLHRVAKWVRGEPYNEELYRHVMSKLKEEGGIQ